MSGHCETLIAILDDGEWHVLAEILAEAVEIQGEGMTVHSRVAQLRERGFMIEHGWVKGERGAKGSRYRLIASPDQLAEARAVSLAEPERSTAPEESTAGSSGGPPRFSGSANEGGSEGNEPEPPPAQMSLDGEAA